MTIARRSQDEIRWFASLWLSDRVILHHTVEASMRDRVFLPLAISRSPDALDEITDVLLGQRVRVSGPQSLCPEALSGLTMFAVLGEDDVLSVASDLPAFTAVRLWPVEDVMAGLDLAARATAALKGVLGEDYAKPVKVDPQTVVKMVLVNASRSDVGSKAGPGAPPAE